MCGPGDYDMRNLLPGTEQFELELAPFRSFAASLLCLWRSKPRRTHLDVADPVTLFFIGGRQIPAPPARAPDLSRLQERG